MTACRQSSVVTAPLCLPANLHPQVQGLHIQEHESGVPYITYTRRKSANHVWSGVTPPMLTYLFSCPAISHPQVQLSTCWKHLTYNIITHNSLKTITPLTYTQTDGQATATEEEKESGVIGSSCTVAANPSLAPWDLCPCPPRPAPRDPSSRISISFSQHLQENVISIQKGGADSPCQVCV